MYVYILYRLLRYKWKICDVGKNSKIFYTVGTKTSCWIILERERMAYYDCVAVITHELDMIDPLQGQVLAIQIEKF